MKECETMKNWIVIPALEPGDGLCAYIRELQQRICASVLVVDDGSGDASRHIFDRIGEMKGCTVLRHGHNRGKGRALKTAFAYVVEHAGQESRIVCVDCDGQHAPEDVEYLLGLAAVEPGTLILGETFRRKECRSGPFSGTVLSRSFSGLCAGSGSGIPRQDSARLTGAFWS